MTETEETVSFDFSEELAKLIDDAFLEAQCKLADGKEVLFAATVKEGELCLKDLSGDPEEAWSLVPQALKEISPEAKVYALVYTGEADEEEEKVSLILMECGEKEEEEGYFLGLPYRDLGYGPEFDELAYLGESDNPCYYLEEE
ncbi:MAG: hypothetical protein IKE21_01415 [Erysipelotrichaceae bacterium]|nr:hypothetical protein [Erysipelotrichaceae bacterium]